MARRSSEYENSEKEIMETINATETISLQLEIVDPDMVAELSKHHGEERSQLAMLALKIGIQAVRMAAPRRRTVAITAHPAMLVE
jgi:hypothetical protein